MVNSGDKDSMDNYKLNCELVGHSLDVRSVTEGNDYLISGSRDKTVKVWSHEGLAYREEVTLKDHSNYVSCVYYLASEDWICSGSNDSTVQIYRAGELKPFIKLSGHSSTVSCLSSGLEARSLVTGSWDKTARIWTIGMDNTVTHKELTGHEAAIWAVATICNEKYVTGSADKTIFIWNKTGERVRVLKGHTDCVRSVIGLENGFIVSAGNDAVIKVWNDMGECVQNLYGHDNYIYTMSLVSPNVVVTGAEDSTIRLWDLEQGKQLGESLNLPAQSVWSVSALKNGDIISGSSDAVVRVFTKNPATMADEDAQKIFQSNVQTFKAEKTKDLGGIKVNDLPGPESLLVEGTDGQTRIVRERDGRIMCYKWEAGQWNLVGDVTGASGGDQQTSGKTLYEGQEYDYVFSVDVEDGKPAIKLPYNNGEDPYMAAQKFIHKHDLPQAYLDQVAGFIIKNSTDAPIQTSAASQSFYDPFTGGSRYVPGMSSDRDLPTGINLDPFTGGASYSSNKDVKTSSRFYPTKEYRTFETMDLVKITQKLREFNNDKAGADKVPDEIIPKFVELASMEEGVTPTEEQMTALNLMMFWSDDIFFPVLDIIRAALTRAAACRHLLTDELFEKLLGYLGDSTRMPTQLMATRCFVNLFKHEVGRSAMERFLNLLMMKFPQKETTNGNLQIALASLLLNFSIRNYKDISSEILVSRIVSFFLNATDLEAIFRVLIAAGNLIALGETGVIQQFRNDFKFMDRLQKYNLESVPEQFRKLNEIAKELKDSLN